VGEAAVVIGVGNPDRGDDGIGSEVAGRLEGRLPGGTRLVRLVGDDPGAAPGTVRRMDAVAGPLPADVGSASTHSLGTAAAIEMARVLGRLPAHLVVYGVEGESFATGAGLSRPVVAAAAEVVEQVLAEAGGG
jgi:hydrogenase maturation protease